MGNFFAGPKTTDTQNTTQNSQQTGATTAQSTQQGSNTQNGTYSQSTTPNLPSWYSSFLQSIPGQYSALAHTLNQNASKPLIGDQQVAAFQGGMNQTQHQNQQALQSQLASQGALNSGRAAQMNTQLALGGQQQLDSYKAMIPEINSQYQQQNLQQLSQVLQGQAGFTSPVSAYGSTATGQNSQTTLSDILNQMLTGSTSSSNGSSQGVSTSQTNPNVLGGLVSGAMGAGMKALTK